MAKWVTVRINHETGITLETLRINRIKGMYTSSVIMTTNYFIAYDGMFGYQALETTKADYKLLTRILELPELNIWEEIK